MIPALTIKMSWRPFGSIVGTESPSLTRDWIAGQEGRDGVMEVQQEEQGGNGRRGQEGGGG